MGTAERDGETNQTSQVYNSCYTFTVDGSIYSDFGGFSAPIVFPQWGVSICQFLEETNEIKKIESLWLISHCSMEIGSKLEQQVENSGILYLSQGRILDSQ